MRALAATIAAGVALSGCGGGAGEVPPGKLDKSLTALKDAVGPLPAVRKLVIAGDEVTMTVVGQGEPRAVTVPLGGGERATTRTGRGGPAFPVSAIDTALPARMLDELQEMEGNNAPLDFRRASLAIVSGAQPRWTLVARVNRTREVRLYATADGSQIARSARVGATDGPPRSSAEPPNNSQAFFDRCAEAADTPEQLSRCGEAAVR
jgi:hypothetical protein